MLAREIRPLFLKHWREIALNKKHIKLDPNWDFYYQADAVGILQITSARHDKSLVGYVFSIVGPHPHYVSTKWAHTDMFWLDPAYRRGWWPVKMFLEHCRQLRKAGAAMHHISHKLRFADGRVALLFRRLGYHKIEEVFAKRL